jgi:hypothetical protein
MFPDGFRAAPVQHLVIYILDPHGTPASLSTLSQLFSERILGPLARAIPAPVEEVAARVVPHIIPCSAIDTWSNLVVRKIASSSYDRLRTPIWRNAAWGDRPADFSDPAHFYAAFAPAVVLGDRPRMPMFLSLEARVRVDAPYNPLEPDRVLHLAYTVRKGRAAGVLVDAFGELLEVFAVGGGDRARLIAKLWIDVLSRVGVRGGFVVRIVVGKVGVLEASEIQGWFRGLRNATDSDYANDGFSPFQNGAKHLLHASRHGKKTRKTHGTLPGSSTNPPFTNPRATPWNAPTPLLYSGASTA